MKAPTFYEVTLVAGLEGLDVEGKVELLHPGEEDEVPH